MRSKSKWAMNGAAAGALMLALATPVFAQSRGDWNRNDSNRYDSRNDTTQQSQQSARRDGASRDNGQYRENERVNLSGHVTSFTRERDGYRVQLDRGNQVWVPQSTFGARARDLRAGVSISVGGVFRGGTVFVDAVTWPDDRGYGYNNDRYNNGRYDNGRYDNGRYDNGRYDNGYDRGLVRGVVDRVDYRDATVWLRDEASGRMIAAQMPAGGRYSRANLRDLRRGDYVELSGQWMRGGVFEVNHVDNVRNRRY